MTTELERLKSWMELTGHDEKRMRSTRGIGHSIVNILKGTRPIHDSFRWYFGREFGNDALLQVFHIDMGSNRECFEPGKSERLWRPEKYIAHCAVQKAILDGRLLPAKTYKCHGCNSQAREYHHESYEPESRLCVVPLCRTCHRRHHWGTAPLSFGVFPASVGIIRIAISSL